MKIEDPTPANIPTPDGWYGPVVSCPNCGKSSDQMDGYAQEGYGSGTGGISLGFQCHHCDTRYSLFVENHKGCAALRTSVFHGTTAEWLRQFPKCSLTCVNCRGAYRREDVLFRESDDSSDFGPLCMHCFATFGVLAVGEPLDAADPSDPAAWWATWWSATAA